MEDFLGKIVEIKPILIGLGEMDHGVHTETLKELLSNFESVDGIFLEYPVNYQGSINHYLGSKVLDEPLKQLLAGGAREGKELEPTLVSILDFASERSVPVICIDSSKNKTEIYNHEPEQGSYFLRSGSRDEDMSLNVLEHIEQKLGTWIIIAHAAHLDFSFDMHKDDPSLGKRLKAKLSDKFFNICLLKDAQINHTKYLLREKLLNEIDSKILRKQGYSFLAQDGRIKGFQGLVIHP